jgi:hypothetical protein
MGPAQWTAGTSRTSETRRSQRKLAGSFTSLLSLPSCQPEKGGRPRNVFSEHSGHSIRSREPVIRCAAGVRGGGASNQSLSRVPTLAEGASSNTSESHLFRDAKSPQCPLHERIGFLRRPGGSSFPYGKPPVRKYPQAHFSFTGGSRTIGNATVMCWSSIHHVRSTRVRAGPFTLRVRPRAFNEQPVCQELENHVALAINSFKISHYTRWSRIGINDFGRQKPTNA